MGLAEEGDTDGIQSEAGLVTWLLHRLGVSRIESSGPPQYSVAPRLDVCCPVSEQGEVLAGLGWPAPPSAGQLMRLMVADAQLSFDLERGQSTNNHKTWAYSRDEYFKTDGDDDRAICDDYSEFYEYVDARDEIDTDHVDDATDHAAPAAPADGAWA